MHTPSKQLGTPGRPRSSTHARHNSFHSSWGGRRRSSSLQEFFWLSPAQRREGGGVEIDPEAMTKQERLSRMLYSPPQIPQMQCSPTLFENFIVVGLSGLRSTRPEILFHYGTSDPAAIPGLAEFCFPAGIKAEKLERTASNSNLFEVLYSQSYAKQPQNSFVFLLTTVQKEMLYGVCVVRTESVQKRPSFCRKRPPIDPKKLHVVAPRCYCLITRYPFFNLHFDVLYSILDLEHIVEMSEFLPLIKTATSPSGSPQTERKESGHTTQFQTPTQSNESSSSTHHAQTPNSAPPSAEGWKPSQEGAEEQDGDPFVTPIKKKMRRRSSSKSASKILKKVKPEKFFVKDHSHVKEEEEAPFPGIRLHVDPSLKHLRLEDNPFPGIPLRTEKDSMPVRCASSPSLPPPVQAAPPKTKPKKKRVVKRREHTSTAPQEEGEDKEENEEENNTTVEQTEENEQDDKDKEEEEEEDMDGEEGGEEEEMKKDDKKETQVLPDSYDELRLVQSSPTLMNIDAALGEDERKSERDGRDKFPHGDEDNAERGEEKMEEGEGQREQNNNASSTVSDSMLSSTANGTSNEEEGQNGDVHETPDTTTDGEKERGEHSEDSSEKEKEAEAEAESDDKSGSDTEKEFFISESEESGNEGAVIKRDEIKASKRFSVNYDNKVIKMLYTYGHHAIPKPNQLMTFFLSSGLNPIRFRRPPSLQNELCDLLREWGMALTFYTLSLDNILTLITCCLLEKKVIIVSKNVRLLSCVIMAIYPLLRPFVYQSVLIPLLPNMLVDFLGAPVPYVLGLTSPPPSSLCPKELVLVDLDVDQIVCTEEIPPLPHLKELRKKFKPFLKHLDRLFKLDRPCYQASEEQQKITEKLSLIFYTHFNALFAHFRKYCLSDRTDSEKPITVFLKESFLADQTKQSKPFFKKFLETQAFLQYCDHRLRKMDDHKKLSYSNTL